MTEWLAPIRTKHGTVLLCSSEALAADWREARQVALSAPMLGGIARVFPGARLETIRMLGGSRSEAAVPKK